MLSGLRRGAACGLRHFRIVWERAWHCPPPLTVLSGSTAASSATFVVWASSGAANPLSANKGPLRFRESLGWDPSRTQG